VRESLAKLSLEIKAQCLGVPIRVDNLHITLAFIGNVTANKLDCLLSVAKAISFKPFEFNLDYPGIFKNSKVIWAGLQDKPVELMQLANELHQGAVDCGIAMDKRPFTPHLSLLRKATHLPALTMQPIHWRVNDFCLLSSVHKPDGVKYKVLYHWS